MPSESIVETNMYFQQYATEYHALSKAAPVSFFARGLSLIDRIISRFIDTQITEQAEYILAHIDRRKIDFLWFGYGNISYPLIKYIKTKRPKLKVVCDTDSVWSRFVLRELPYTKGWRKLKIWLSGQRKKTEEQSWS